MPRPSSSTRDRAVGVQRDGDALAVAGQRLVGGVVDHFLHDVQRVVGAGVHARPLLDGLEPLQDADGTFGVFAGLLGFGASGALFRGHGLILGAKSTDTARISVYKHSLFHGQSFGRRRRVTAMDALATPAHAVAAALRLGRALDAPAARRRPGAGRRLRPRPPRALARAAPATASRRSTATRRCSRRWPALADTLVADLEADPWPLPGRRFDAVRRHQLPVARRCFRRCKAAVAPGGLLIYETFAQAHAALGRPRRPEFLLRPGRVDRRPARRRSDRRRAAPSPSEKWHVIAFEEGRLPARGDVPEREVQRIVARRGSAPPGHADLLAPPG